MLNIVIHQSKTVFSILLMQCSFEAGEGVPIMHFPILNECFKLLVLNLQHKCDDELRITYVAEMDVSNTFYPELQQCKGA